MTDNAPAPAGRNFWRWLPVAGFAALAGVFLVGLWREDGDALPSPLIDKPAPNSRCRPCATARPVFHPPIWPGKASRW